MKLFLPADSDNTDSIVKSFHIIGLSTKNGFEWQKLDEPTKRGLIRAAETAEKIIDNSYEHSAKKVNGWRYVMLTGQAGEMI